VVREGIHTAIVTLLNVYLLFVSCEQDEQVDPSAVAQHIIVKFLTNEKVKRAENLRRFRAQFGDKMVSRTQTFDWSKSFKECQIEVENK
jgi:hypothetical protein